MVNEILMNFPRGILTSNRLRVGEDVSIGILMEQFIAYMILLAITLIFHVKNASITDIRMKKNVTTDVLVEPYGKLF